MKLRRRPAPDTGPSNVLNASSCTLIHGMALRVETARVTWDACFICPVQHAIQSKQRGLNLKLRTQSTPSFPGYR